MTLNTMKNQKPVREILEHYLNTKGFITILEKDIDFSDRPVKYLVKNAKYSTIYGTRGSSEFLIVDKEKKISIRVEIKIQEKSGSVDEKYPYMYINALTMHPDDVIIILEGAGYKKGARDWIEDKIKDNWLNNGTKNVQLLSLIEAINYFDENLWGEICWT